MQGPVAKSFLMLCVCLLAGLGAHASAALRTPGPQARAGDTAAKKPIIEGVWTLNPGASTSAGDLAAPQRAASAPSRGGSGGGGGFGGFGRGGRGGGGGGRGGSAAGRGNQTAGKQRDLIQEIATAPGRLTIVMTPTEAQITYDTGQFSRFFTSGKEESHDLTNGTIKTKTQWDGAVLTQNIDAGNNYKFVRTFAVSGDQLIISVTPGPVANATNGGSGNSGGGSSPGSSTPTVEKRSVYDPSK